MTEHGARPAATPRQFTTTDWRLVLTAGHSSLPESAEALASLCRRYWYPVYAQVRRAGHRPDEARDLVQGFFTQLLEKRSLRVARPERGRFRAFLKTSIQNYLSNERDRRLALKRGSGRSPIPLDIEEAETRYARELHRAETPETIFERRWARALLGHVLDQLRAETPPGERERFKRIECFLTGDGSGRPYRQIADELGTTEAAIKMAVRRARWRFGKLLRAEIARTVDDAQEVDAEIRFLFSALQR